MPENEKLNFSQNEFTTVDEGLEKLKDAVKLRNQMGGALYWNILNDDCLAMAAKLMEMGVEQDELVKIING